jgi:tetratricopeptide (TPR) repeat protein
MPVRVLIASLLISVSLTAGAQFHDPRALAAEPAAATGPIAPVLSGLGDYTRPVSTESTESAAFFNQGLRLTYAFNHSEALRAFKEAVRLDANNAMAYWGWALVLGPNLNLPMQPDLNESAYTAIQAAMDLRELVTPVEAALIEALNRRYAPTAPDDRSVLDAAYAEAMAGVVQRFPDDLDAATLYAAALMNQSPWNYWYRDGQPYARTEIILSSLESVLARERAHPGALHYYIHAVEAQRPEDGIDAADTLRGLMPAAGHMMHMPSHIYMRVGRYQDGYEVNIDASEADENYIAQCRAQGLYPVGYYPHNLHFLVWAATLQGKSTAALRHARKIERELPQFLELEGDVPRDVRGDAWRIHEHFMSQSLYTLVRFGRWQAILKEPRPPESARFMTGIWHYARGVALANSGNSDAARAELDELSAVSSESGMDDYWINASLALDLLAIAEDILSAEIARNDGDLSQTVAYLEKAVRRQDTLAYTEPPDWYFPTRHFLGAALLEAGYPREAEAVYWQDLRLNPANAYSLFGLKLALEAQGRTDEAAAIARRFDAAWQAADVELVSSRF